MTDTKGYSRQDRDLLISLSEQIKQVRADILELKDNTSGKIADHETRLRRLETWGFIALGVLYAIQAYFGFVRK